MTEMKDKIAERLEVSFADKGFAEPGIDDLRENADVSLRTLYRYFPSREAMVRGALEHRNRRYLGHLTQDEQPNPDVLELFHRLGTWLEGSGNNGCLFLNALAAHPGSDAVRDVAKAHKSAVQSVFFERLSAAAPTVSEDRRQAIADALVTIHEGQVMTSIVNGPKAATETAVALAQTLLQAKGIQ